MLGLDSHKPTACCRCCLSVTLLLCADWALLMSLWTHSSGGYCCADMLTECASLDLELKIYEPVRAPQRHTHCCSGMVYSLSSTSPLPLFLISCDCWGVIGPERPSCSSFWSILGLASYFSCVNGFVLSDTCESARLWAFVSSAAFPPLSSEHLCFAGFTFCSGFRRGFALVISSSCLIISYVKNKQRFYFYFTRLWNTQGEQLYLFWRSFRNGAQARNT